MSEGIGTKFDKVCAILDKYEHNPHKLIAILQDMQEEYNYLPEDIMTFVSTALGISPSTVYGVATFYSHFTLQPKGKHVIKLCDGTACHVKKSHFIYTGPNGLGTLRALAHTGAAFDAKLIFNICLPAADPDGLDRAHPDTAITVLTVRCQCINNIIVVFIPVSTVYGFHQSGLL
jgi:hypothetical protein